MSEALFQGPPKGADEIIPDPKALPQGPPKGNDDGKKKKGKKPPQ
jgi:hypothetical protein